MLRSCLPFILTLVLPLTVWSWQAPHPESVNPVIAGDFADPSVIRVNDVYYAVGTSSEWAPHLPLFSSKDLVRWKQEGYVFDKKPDWTLSSFWAPEYFYHNNTYYMYYVARRRSDSISCIGVATSRFPDKDFTDQGIVVAYGREAIDPFIISDSGRLYMTFKAYGLDKRPIELLGVALSPDGKKVEGEPFMLLRDDAKVGIEGQAIVRKDGYYYLFYSAGACCGRKCSYYVNVARSASIKGPYEINAANPVLDADAIWKCPGHGTLVRSPADDYYYLYHAYSKKDHVFTGRQGLLKKVLWNEKTGWPYFDSTASRNSDVRGGRFTDDFSGQQLGLEWQWDFRNARPQTTFSEGALSLSGEIGAGNPTGTAITVRPVSGDYEMTTSISNMNASVGGLVIYGDAGASVGIGRHNNSVEVWEVKDGKRSVLREQAVSTTGPLSLKMSVTAGAFCRFYWRAGRGAWKEIAVNGGKPYDGNHLPPWDRSPRPGLCHYGSSNAPAVFTDFSIVYR